MFAQSWGSSAFWYRGFSNQILGDSQGSAWPCSTGGEDEEGEEDALGL